MHTLAEDGTTVSTLVELAVHTSLKGGVMRTVCFCMVLTCAAQAPAVTVPDGWTVRQISKGTMVLGSGEYADERYLQASGENLLWQELTRVRDYSAELVLWDGTTIHRISNAPHNGFVLFDDNVFWCENTSQEPFSYELWFWDGSRKLQIHTTSEWPSNLTLSGSQAAWIEASKVMFWNGTAVTQISSGAGACQQCQLSEGQTVWIQKTSDTSNQVIHWDGGTIRQISAGKGNCSSPMLSHGQAVWRQNVANAYQIMYWDGSMTRQVSSGEGNYCSWYTIDQGRLAWVENHAAGPQLFCQTTGAAIPIYHGGTDAPTWTNTHLVWFGPTAVHTWDGQQVRTIGENAKRDRSLSVSDDLLIWSEQRQGPGWYGRILFSTDFETEQLLAEGWGHGPAVAYGRGIAFIACDKNYDVQVFLAEPGGTPVVTRAPASDLNKDNIVDVADLSILASEWLDTSDIRIARLGMDFDPGWTATGQWQFGMPVGGGSSVKGSPDPYAGFTGRKVYGVNLNGDYSTQVGSQQTLTAGPFCCSGYGQITLSFARWLNCDTSDYVRCTVDVSTDGETWASLWINPMDTPVTDDQWQVVQYDISQAAAGQLQLYVRWTHQIVNERALPYSGWNIDDVEMWGKGK